MFNSPYRRKKDLQEIHDKTLKLFPRAISPQIQHNNGKLGSRPAVNFFLPMLFNQIHKNICLFLLIIKYQS